MSEGANRADGRGSGCLSRLRRAGPVVLALVGLSLVVAACSSGSTGPGVASLGPTTSTTTLSRASQGGIGSANYTDAVASAQCMRSRGIVNFPDPNSQGNFLLGKSVNAPSSLQYTSADRACEHLLPNGGQITPAEQHQMLAAAVKFVACMRARGVPNFPDPTTAGGGVNFSINPRVTGIDPRSQNFQVAQRVCQSLMPDGGP